MSNAIKSGAAEELMRQIETNSIQWTTNGNTDLSSATANKLLRIQWTNFNQTKAAGCLRNVITRGADTRNKPNCCV